MAEVPSLMSLCMKKVGKDILRDDFGNDLSSAIYELPSDLFDGLLMHLPPLALQKLQEEMPLRCWNGHESTNICFRNGRKRGSCGNFNTAWKALFKSRWPDLARKIQRVDWSAGVAKYESIIDWQQMYWETHLQNCIDEAAEIAVLPSFDGCLGEIEIPDTIIKCIGYKGHRSHSTCDYSKLSYHCEQFGSYARCLKLQNMLCIAETSHLLRKSRLQQLVLRWIKSTEHMDGLCQLLQQNNETLSSLEFIFCNLSSASLNAICDSLRVKDMQTYRIQHFSITNTVLERNPVSLPHGLVSFLSSGRSLCSLKFSDNRLGKNFAKLVFNTLLDASSRLSTLNLADNNITGWLFNFNQRSSTWPLPSFGLGKSLQLLRVLNLRGNNLCKDDADNLKYALIYMPNLEILDLSDNPIEDDGISSLIPYFVEASERHSPLADLSLGDCDLSCNGVTQLLDVLSTLKNPLHSLSIAHNELGSQAAGPLGKFLRTFIRVLNVEDIGLGSSGFLKLQEDMPEEVKLVSINISKNRGRLETANFLLKLMSKAPELLVVNAAYNFMPVESLTVVHSSLKVGKGKLERLDLRGNARFCQSAHAPLFDEFQHRGRPIVILPPLPAADEPYDDDP